ncbi:alpha/beta fold hydrolase [Galbibacter sp.]|jgi:pimeloyl-ACP methyl ester carboxylesterase|uniref:alpha/beta fold hydrolase n=1 Tax=Galbibacter sp. TaxID=2918471 RepID=UPI003A917437
MGTSIAFWFCNIILATIFGQIETYPFEVQKTGEGITSMIFIPGFGCSGEVWDQTKANFENDFNCYTLTMAGFAGVPAKGNPSFDHWKTSIADFIKDKAIKKPILVGHSMGGVLAMAIAADYPDLVDRIVVVDGLPCLQALSNPLFTSVKEADCSAMVNQMTSISDEQFYQMQKASIPQMVADTSMQDEILAWTVDSDREVFASMYCDFWNTDLREKISTIKCPVLVMLSSGMVNFKSSIDAQFKNLTTADIQYAKKGLHFIMFDDRQWYLDQLINFTAGQ